MTLSLITRIFRDYHAGKPETVGTKYRYTVEYNPLSALPWWIIRADRYGRTSWEMLQPLPCNMQITPRNSVFYGACSFRG